MCINPRVLESGVQVACRQCWQCRSQRVDDLVGRCIAEGVDAVETHVVTLTYGRDKADNILHDHAVQLFYRDVANMLKLLRVHGYPCRYMVAGEYGGENRRTHWHGVLMWQDKVPIIPPLDKRMNWYWSDAQGVLRNWWPHGFVFFEKPAFEKLRYNLKYALKDEAKGSVNALGYSRKPPLGYRYFRSKAIKMAVQGLVPRDPFYSFADVRRQDGTLRKFRLMGKSLDLFLEAYTAEWRKLYGERHIPPSEFYEEWLDSRDRDVRFDIMQHRVATVGALREPVAGYVSSFQANGGSREWLEKPVGRTLPISGRKLDVSEKGPKMGESYVAYRMRQLKEQKLLEAGSSLKVRKVSDRR